MSLNNENSEIDPRAEYWSVFRQHAHQLVAWGYSDARSLIESHCQEEDITGFITEAIQSRLQKSSDDSWPSRYNVKENMAVPGKGLTGKKRKRPDIIIEHNTVQRPQYIFEVKRMNLKMKYLERQYLKKGLRRFIAREYASEYPEAAMIGYAQDGTTKDWANRVKALMRSESTRSWRLGVEFISDEIRVIDSFTDEWKSEHTRDDKSPFSIYHIFVDCV